MKKGHFKRGLSLLMSFLMICGVLTTGMFATKAEAEAVANPNAVIDIVVNVPADYPGTFLDFKEELTEKLIAQGLDESTFRIISSAIKIDTTDTSGWYIYDHYNSSSDYNNLRVDPNKQPFRQADNSYATGANPTTIEKEFENTLPTTCRYFARHIASSTDAAGKAKMVFAGYGAQALTDYMIYPAASDSRRTFSFDIDAKRVDTHTLTGAGFFVNAGINGSGSSATVSGYLLFYQFSSATSGNIYLIPVNNINAMNLQTSNITSLYGSAIATDTFSLNSTKKARIDVDLQSTKLTVQQRNYTSTGTFEETKTLFGGKAVTMNPTGFNGFGPMAAYGSHSCSSLSSFEFSDLEMNYEASAFDSLKNLQYSDTAEYKYFINLAGTNGDPGVPKEGEGYLEGITRLNKNEIFYISNVDDGKVLTEPSGSSSGIGPDNGLYATNSDYVSQMAEYIADNYKNHVKYKPVELQQKKEKPIADFSIVDNSDETKQVLTMHLQHLKTSSDRVVVKIHDKSVPSDTGARINGWSLKVYDPNNNVVVNSNGFKSSPNQLPTYTFYKNSKQGKYTFELTVRDEKGITSSVFQTYLIAYTDDQPANISATSKGIASEAKISLVDTGWGIKDDGVVLVENQGSGVLKYQLNDGEIVTLPKEVHAYNVKVPLTKDALKIRVWDECGNQSERTFQTAQVSFENDVHEPYYVLKGDTLGELPAGEEKENEFFQGWATADGNIVSSETPVNADVVLHPVYTSDKVTLTFDANQGTFADDATQTTVQVPKGSMIIDHLLSGEQLPVREGYTFVNWTYNGQEIKTQTANADITLTANWKKASYKLIFDANGGNLGKLKEKTLEYGDNILTATQKDAAGSNYQGTYLPTNEGYTFINWAADKQGTAISPSATMPASDYTVYAQWQKDNSKYIVSFDSNGGSPVTNKSYPSSQSTYGTLNTPSRSGYIFDGWYDEGGQKRESNGAVYKTADHELTAHWTAKDDTQYKIEYYFKTDAGYSRDDSLTVVKRGTTDTACSVSDEDIKEVSGYWYNADSENNVLDGTITGDGKMTLKLYYDRYFNIAAEAKGEGEISASSPVKEGSAATAEWTPNEGYVVHRVMVDGIIRDDLLSQNSFTWDDVHSHHQIYVEFVPNGSIDGNDPSIGNNDYYQVKTVVNGPHNSCDITPTKTVLKGTDHTVTWTVKEGYFISSITVDGKDYSVDSDSVEFKSVNANHEVVVNVEGYSYPSNGGGASDGHYTITVNRYGGNMANTTVSDSCVVNPGDSKEITWSADGGYHVIRVVVDGVVLTADEIEAGLYSFENVNENHVVDVYFATEGDNHGSWGEDMVTVTTQLIGASGTITSGATLDVGSEYTVEWNPVLETGNGPEDANYGVYEIDRVEVNDEVVSTDGNSIHFDSLDQNKDVKVYVKPVVYNINILKYGAGTVSESKTLFRGQSYLSIEGVPGDGNEVVKLVVDDVEQPITDAAAMAASESEVVQATKSMVQMNVNEISQNHKIVVYFAAPGEAIPGDDDLVGVTAEIIGGTGTVYGEGVFNKGDSSVVGWTLDDGYVVTGVAVNGEYYEFDGSEISLDDLQTNTHVEIFVTSRVPGDDLIPDSGDNGGGSEDTAYGITTEIVGGPGEITNSTGVKPGDSHTVEWDVSEDGYVIRDVIVDGISRPDLITPDGIGSITFDDIDSDHKVVVIVGKGSVVDIDVDGDGIPDVNIDTDKDGLPDVNIDLDGDLVPNINIDTDNTGEWHPSSEGGNQDGIWKPDTNLDTNGDGTVNVDHGFRPGYDKDGDGVDDSWNPSKDVYPDGLANPGYDTSDPNVNIDTDGDGIPDINIDTDGDGRPDVNIDTNGDGTPDINIDTNGDGVPDINIDNGGGRPEINIDTDGDGKPDVNIDTDGDGKPDVNIDTNGDGTPDINIDKDGDGTPDINIDIDKDGSPDTNIDTDGDGKPDINIDTDGDGKPDINIDKDGDGTPDINIDTDGDGKPDVNIDTDGDGKPDLNVDVDGDGKPDVNIDTNGDGIADTNIDANGDGIPDDNNNGGSSSDTSGGAASSAQTGDTSFIALWIVLLFVSLGGFVLLRQLKKR